MSNAALVQLALDTKGQYPSELVEAADYLEKVGQSGVPVDDLKSDHLEVLKGILGSNIVENGAHHDDFDVGIGV